MSLVGSYANSFGLQPVGEQLYGSYYARFDTAPSDHNPSPTGQQTYFPGWTFAASPETDFGSPPPYTPSPNAVVQDNIATTSMTLGAEFCLQSEAKPDTFPVRPVKRRYTANRKERRRTLSINNAFADLRDCIPNVPADTKLSKIKTLRLATSYIAYLMDVLSQDPRDVQQRGDFRAEICRKTENTSREQQETCMVKARKAEIVNNLVNGLATTEKKPKGRTGWPQHVWALELKHDP